MSDDMMSLRGHLEKTRDADVLREMVGFAAKRLMELTIGGRHRRRPMARRAPGAWPRNGYRDRDWLAAAAWIYGEIFAQGERHASLSGLLSDVFTTRAGLALLIVGHVVGLGFAVFVLSISVISLPLLLDRDGEVGLVDAIMSSVRATRLNAGPVFFFGLVVAALLMAGSLPLFVGLCVVLPVLGHATWRLYRRIVAFPGAA